MTNNIITIDGIQCYEKDGTAYLNLEAVARGLGFTKKADSGNEVVNWTRVREYLFTLGVVQKCTTGDFIPENIFYRLAMKAKNETAEKFQALVADKIIPSIRKNGGYIATDGLSDKEILARALLIANKAIEEKNAQIEEMHPKAVFADAVAASKNAILVGEMAKLLQQNGVPDMGEKRLFEWMRDNGFLIRRNGADRNMPTQRAMEMGLFRIKETAISHSDGHTTVNKTPKVTGKGQAYFVNLFLEGECAHGA